MRQVLAALVVALCAAPVVPAASELDFTPYVWIPGIDGTIGTGGGGGSGLGDRVELDFAPEYRIGGAMLIAGWREKRFVAFGDWTYANVRAESASPFGALYSGVNGQIIGNIVQLYAGYALVDRGGTKLDAFVGGRGYGLTGRLGLDAGAAPEVKLSANEAWVDAAAGLRLFVRPGGKWLAQLRADVGSGGSSFTWQGYAIGGYEFSWGAVIAGWRHLYVDKGEGALRLRLSLSGPLLGAAIRFDLPDVR